MDNCTHQASDKTIALIPLPGVPGRRRRRGLLILGLLTPLIAVALAVTMAVALVAQHLENGFFVAAGDDEFVLVLGVASLAAAAIGPGRLSLDHALKLPRRVRSRARPATAAR